MFQHTSLDILIGYMWDQKYLDQNLWFYILHWQDMWACHAPH